MRTVRSRVPDARSRRLRTTSDTSAIRILLIIDSLPHYRSGFIHGLADRYQLAAAFVPNYSPTIPAMAKGNERRVQLRLHRYGPIEWFVGAMNLAWRSDYDVLLLFANGRWPHVWLATLAARLRRRIVFHWGHGWTGREHAAIGYLRRLLHSGAHATLVFGDHARELAVHRYGARGDAVHVIGNSLPWTDQPVGLARPPGDHSTVILVSRLVPERRATLLVEAVAELAERGRSISAIIVGDGPGLEDARAMAARLGVDLLVEFAGACYDDAQLRRFYGAASLMVIPGKVGLAAVAAAGYGLPIVCSSDPARHAPEVELVEDGVTGVLFNSDDRVALADAIERGLDPDSWSSMSANARSIVKLRYSPQAQLSVFTQVLNQFSRRLR